MELINSALWNEDMSNQWRWVGVNNVDVYKVQSGYWALKGLPHIQENVSFREVWSLKVPNKAKVFG